MCSGEDLEDWQAFLARYDNPDYLLPSERDALADGTLTLSPEAIQAQAEERQVRLREKVEWSWTLARNPGVQHHVGIRTRPGYVGLLWWEFGNTSPYDDGALDKSLGSFFKQGPYIQHMPPNFCMELFWALRLRGHSPTG